VIITQSPFERLLLGDLRAADRLAYANPLRIRTVLSVCPEEIQSRSPQITYVQLPMLDAQPLPFEVVDQVMRTIARNISAGRLLIHCAAGFSRSPVVAAIYLDLVGYRGFDEALDELAGLRPIDPSPILVRSAKEYLKTRVEEVLNGINS
jgi:atypical dual specificity phosphatase